MSPYRRPSNYPYPKEFKTLSDANQYAKDMYRALLENDSSGTYLEDRAIPQQTGVSAMTNVTTPANLDANTVTTAELADIVGNLINKLRAQGLVDD